MKCVILQPSYIPWRGYFHQIARSDVFVFYDDVQYDTRGWRNRNRIKTADGTRWLTIPVHSKGAQTDHIAINKIKIDWSKSWNEQHWQTLKHAYAKAPFFSQFSEKLQEIYSQTNDLLADFTIPLTIQVSNWLGFSTSIYSVFRNFNAWRQNRTFDFDSSITRRRPLHIWTLSHGLY